MPYDLLLEPLWNDRHTGDHVLVIGRNGYPTGPIIDAEKDMLTGQEACVGEQVIGDLHPGESDASGLRERAVAGASVSQRGGHVLDGVGA